MAGFRFIGTTDECIECQRCGKADLKSTVVLEILDADGNGGEFTYYGSSCAARALTEMDGRKRTGASVLKSAQLAEYNRQQQLPLYQATLDYYAAVEHGTTKEQADAYFARNPQMRGKISARAEVARIIADCRQKLRPLV